MSTAGQMQRDPLLSDGDRTHMTRKGWFPKTDFPLLEEMRSKHEAMIDTRDAKQDERAALEERFEAEDEARAEALRAGYREQRDAQLPEVTPKEERKRLLEDAEEHARAAAHAVLTYARECLYRLRGEVPHGWNQHQRAGMLQVPPHGEATQVMQVVQQEERELQQQIEEAHRAVEAANARLREYHPLKVWLARNANGGSGQITPATSITVPATHTPMTKPRDLPVADWWPDSDPNHGQEEPVGSDPALDTQAIPTDAEEGYVDQSDEWFQINERKEL